MLLSFHTPSRRRAAARLYEEAVRQARRGVFYSELGVPDTVDGRFDLVSLHVFLILQRLRKENRKAQRTAQALFNHMFVDMDVSLREQGVGDLSIPRHVRRMMQAFNGRCLAYAAALYAANADGLADALERNIYAGQGMPGQAERIALTGYVRQCADLIAHQPLEALLEGKVQFIREVKDESIAIHASDAGMVA